MINEISMDINHRIDTLEKNIESLLQICRDHPGTIEYKNRAEVPLNLENANISEQNVSPKGDMDMSMKIRRRIMIGGQLQWICASTEQEYAEALMRAMGTAVNTQGEANKPKHPFEAYAMRWFEVFSKPNVDRTTAITYERQLKNSILPVLGGMNLEDITVSEVQEVFNRMDKAHRKSAATKQKVRMVLNMIFAQAMDEDLIVKDPMKSRSLRVKGMPAKPTEPYTVEEMTFLSQHLNELSQSRDRNYLALHIFHPFRLEEVLGLRWKDIDLPGGVIHIRCTVTHPDRNQAVFQEKTKTDKSRRDIALVREIIPYLTIGKPEEFVVGGDAPMSYTQVTRMCERIRRETGFSQKITPLRFRTTVLTDIYDATKDIKETQAAAGHTTSAMTLRYYVKGRAQSEASARAIAGRYLPKLQTGCERICEQPEVRKPLPHKALEGIEQAAV